MGKEVDICSEKIEIKKEFWENIQEFANRLEEIENPLLVSHHDADGITACAILIDLFEHLGIKADYLIAKQLDSSAIEDVIEKSRQGQRPVVFSDMGSGQLDMLEEHDLQFYVIDHHNPQKEHKNQVNPHFYGYNGGREISGAGMSYLVAKALGRIEMAPIALVGAVGDMQDSMGQLESLNRIILKDAVKQKKVRVENDLRLFGRQSRPLHLMLTYASDPILPGLTGNQDACIEFIESLGIDPKKGNQYRNYVDLTEKERKELISALYIKLLDANIPEYVIQGMVGEVYTLLEEKKGSELRDTREFATVMNACGRQEQPEMGVHVCLGDRGEKWMQAQSLLQKHRSMLKEGIEYLSDKGVEEQEQIYLFDSDGIINERLIGVIAGMAYGAKIIPPDKPILAFAPDKDDPEKLKVSARANWKLVRSGVHLGKAMEKGSASVGGEGGGHDIASGARIPKNRKKDFIKEVDSILEKQVA